MTQFGELLQATSSDTSLLVLFVPSADREGDALGKKEQKRWVRKALKLLGQRFTGATAFPRGWGTGGTIPRVAGWCGTGPCSSSASPARRPFSSKLLRCARFWSTWGQRPTREPSHASSTA